jgi:hypothetical protein
MSRRCLKEEEKKVKEAEEKKREEEKEAEQGGAKKRKKVADVKYADSGRIDGHVFHVQDPGNFENNCSFAAWFSFLELLCLMGIKPSYKRYRAVTEAGKRVHKCLQRLERLFQRVVQDLSDHDPINKSSTSLRIWLDMVQEVCPSEMPKVNPSNSKINCVGGELSAYIIPLTSLLWRFLMPDNLFLGKNHSSSLLGSYNFLYLSYFGAFGVSKYFFCTDQRMNFSLFTRGDAYLAPDATPSDLLISTAMPRWRSSF